MLEGVLFDSDGILVDSEPKTYLAFHQVFLNFGVDLSEEEFVRRWMIEQTTIPGIIRDYGLQVTADELREYRRPFFLKAMQESELMPGAEPLVKRFRGEYPIGVVTSTYRKDLDTKVGKFGLLDLFDIIVAKEDVTRTKPHPEPYQKGCEKLRTNPRYTVVIEDNPGGVKSALGAGCRVVAYPNGFTENLEFPKGITIVRSLDEIDQELLERVAA